MNNTKKKNKDPRFEGFRLSLKGFVVFFIGWSGPFFSGILNHGKVPEWIHVIFIPIAVFGMLIALKGMIKHYKDFFGPFDPKRAVDPGYDFDYVICQHCKKTKIRAEGKSVKCPICKKKTKISSNQRVSGQN